VNEKAILTEDILEAAMAHRPRRDHFGENRILPGRIIDLRENPHNGQNRQPVEFAQRFAPPPPLPGLPFEMILIVLEKSDVDTALKMIETCKVFLANTDARRSLYRALRPSLHKFYLRNLALSNNLHSSDFNIVQKSLESAVEFANSEVEVECLLLNSVIFKVPLTTLARHAGHSGDLHVLLFFSETFQKSACPGEAEIEFANGVVLGRHEAIIQGNLQENEVWKFMRPHFDAVARKIEFERKVKSSESSLQDWVTY
jgi:hypothetical protein